MSDSPLIVKSKAFALEVIQVCKKLRAAKCESALINQFLRSGTSIGANIREAFYAHGKADFIAKLQIALKECSETEYWIELVLESGYYHDKTLLGKCTELKRILISFINTATFQNCFEKFKFIIKRIRILFFSTHHVCKIKKHIFVALERNAIVFRCSTSAVLV